MLSYKHQLYFYLKTVVIIAFLTPVYSYSQETIGIDSLTFKKPIVIELSDVIEEIESTDLALEKTIDKIKPLPSILEIDSLLPNYIAYLTNQKDLAYRFIKENPNRQKINHLINRWENYIIHLERWEKTINKVENDHDLFLDEISSKEQTWQLTYDNARSENAPNDVVREISSLLNQIKNTRTSIFKQKNQLLSLESKVNKEKRQISTVINDLIRLKESEVYHVFYRRHEPLWETSFKLAKGAGLENKIIQESIPQKISYIFTLIKKDSGNLFLYFMTVVFLTLLINFLKKSFEKYPFNEEDRYLQRSKSTILNNSRESIIFLSLFIARFYFKEAPSLFVHLTVFFLLIVCIPLIKPVIYNRFKNILVIVVLFFLLDLVKSYVWFSSLFYRFYLMLEAVLFIATMYYYTHPYQKLRNLNNNNLGGLLIKLIPYLYLISFISIITNILGYTNIGELAIRININSAIIIVLFYAFLMTLSGIVTGVIHYNFSKQKNFNAAKKFKIETKFLTIIRAFVILYCIVTFLNLIDLWLPLTNYSSDILSKHYVFGSVSFTLGMIATFLLILVLSFLATSIISLILNGESLTFLKLPKGIPAAISLVIRYLIIGFGFVLALSSLGLNLGKFNLMAGALGLGIGFGLQTVISNFISGLILVFERPILPGDTVEVNNLLGVVKKIGIRSSKISTFDGAEVIVPNNNLISDDLINWTLSNNIKRVEILIGTTYSADPNKTLKLLAEVAIDNENVLKDPTPIALFNDFGQSSLNFKLRFWVNYEIGLQVKSDISIAVYNKFKEHGIEIPFPQQDIYIKSIPQQFKTGKELSQSLKNTTNKQQLNETIDPNPDDLNSDEK